MFFRWKWLAGDMLYILMKLFVSLLCNSQLLQGCFILLATLVSHLAGLSFSFFIYQSEDFSVLLECYDLEFLKHCEFQGGKIHGNAEDGHYFNSLFCGVFAQRRVYHKYFFDKLVWSGMSKSLSVCNRLFVCALEHARTYLKSKMHFPGHFRSQSIHTTHSCSTYITFTLPAQQKPLLPNSRGDIMNPVQSPWRNRQGNWLVRSNGQSVWLTAARASLQPRCSLPITAVTADRKSVV